MSLEVAGLETGGKGAQCPSPGLYHPLGDWWQRGPDILPLPLGVRQPSVCWFAGRGRAAAWTATLPHQPPPGPKRPTGMPSAWSGVTPTRQKLGAPRRASAPDQNLGWHSRDTPAQSTSSAPFTLLPYPTRAKHFPCPVSPRGPTLACPPSPLHCPQGPAGAEARFQNCPSCPPADTPSPSATSPGQGTRHGWGL